MPSCDTSALSPQSTSPSPSKYIDYGDVGEYSHHTHSQPSHTLTPHHSPTSHHSRYGCTGHIWSMAGRYQHPHLSSWSVVASLLQPVSLTHCTLYRFLLCLPHLHIRESSQYIPSHTSVRPASSHHQPLTMFLSLLPGWPISSLC